MLTRRSGSPVPHGSTADSSSQTEIDLAGAPDFEIAALKVQPSTLQAHFDGMATVLEPRVMQLIVALADGRGAVVSRDRLVGLCWAGYAVSEDAINRCVAKARRLGTESKAFHIETIPRVGYRLIEAHSRAKPKAGKRKRLLPWALAVVLAAFLVAFAFWQFRPSTRVGPAAAKVALAGFKSLNPGEASQQFAQSIDAAVSDALTNVGADVVAAPPSDDARNTGDLFLIGGTVRRDGDSVHVTARIADARNREDLLSASFDVPSNDAALTPDRVAAWVADTVGSWSWIVRSERDPDHIDALIKIQGYWTDDDVRAYHLARDLAKSAPTAGAAQLVFAEVVPFALSDLPQAERREAVEAARMSARRADSLLTRAGDLSMAECGLHPPGQFILTSACEGRVQEALRLDPDAYYLPQFYAAGLVETGRYAAAEAMSKKALAAAPFSQNRTAQRLEILWMLPPHYGSDFELAQFQAAARRRWAPPSSIDNARYKMLLGKGEMDKAERILDDPQTAAMIETDEKGPAHLIFRALHSRSPVDIRAANAACDPPPPKYLPPDLVFGTCLNGLAALGDLDSVFSLAQRGYQDVLCCSGAQIEQKWLISGGQSYPRSYLFGSIMAAVRADRRFIEIARRTGLLPYWKSGRPPDFCFSERAPVCQLLNSK